MDSLGKDCKSLLLIAFLAALVVSQRLEQLDFYQVAQAASLAGTYCHGFKHFKSFVWPGTGQRDPSARYVFTISPVRPRIRPAMGNVVRLPLPLQLLCPTRGAIHLPSRQPDPHALGISAPGMYVPSLYPGVIPVGPCRMYPCNRL
jgi:hypothetical protein